jgi:hypothetical protein
LRSLEVREKREQVESFDLDEALEEATRAPRARPGDLWVLGDHRDNKRACNGPGQSIASDTWSLASQGHYRESRRRLRPSLSRVMAER